jgi:mono/diheme cytochrome c family protein
VRRRARAALAAALAGTLGCSPAYDAEQASVRGKVVYEQYCLGCHQASGRGVPNMTPPLVASEWLSGDPDRLIRVVLAGLAGPLEDDGEEYDAVMGAQAYLSDQEVADVLTYVRGRFAPGTAVVTPEEVARVRSGLEPDAAVPGAPPPVAP